MTSLRRGAAVDGLGSGMVGWVTSDGKGGGWFDVVDACDEGILADYIRRPLVEETLDRAHLFGSRDLTRRVPAILCSPHVRSD